MYLSECLLTGSYGNFSSGIHYFFPLTVECLEPGKRIGYCYFRMDGVVAVWRFQRNRRADVTSYLEYGIVFVFCMNCQKLHTKQPDK